MSRVADQPALDDELAGRAQHAEQIPGQAELVVVSEGRSFDFELLAGAAQSGVDVQRHARATGVQDAADREPLAVERGALRHEADTRVALDVEEVRRAEVLVAPVVLRVEAVGLDGQFDGRLARQVERALVAREAALDGRDPPEAPGVELDARAVRVDPPDRLLDARGGDGVGGVRAHGRWSPWSRSAVRWSDSAAGRPVTAQRWRSLSGFLTMRTVCASRPSGTRRAREQRSRRSNRSPARPSARSTRWCESCASTPRTRRTATRWSRRPVWPPSKRSSSDIAPRAWT